ncbi:MAG: NAD-dependent epimerase/dehydratase family protein [Gammaproteobacteria bacterium]|nr:NAD-dependent epimerase/dehydratase family protein [Gammaproteobacteria bacterium]
MEHLVFASTSLMYGLNRTLPFSPHHGVDHPVSLYASTSYMGELMGHNYAELFRLPVTVLRLFTVYGPWGRPDMPPILFAKKCASVNPSMCSTTVTTAATSRSSTISSTARCASRIPFRPPTPRGTPSFPTARAAERRSGCSTLVVERRLSS